ncbi:hypothetical protein DUNSADRAFT_18340 [Dunaliella salina]|uniref:Uncharacterized protein n=1 Tax=Dunaliella salina TaxID=3046 RepID=A0ABQ7GZE6_DUNSA|nr:hypothetical protein DUNSADRAFT_18340 [Dunaliella salina]|eukprot:KAF5839926.1 hypothetical protein DUNSADRAFT_18340 [Dunaliella salina]
MAESNAAAAQTQQGKPNLSSKLKSMRFMQRASEKRNLQQLSSKGPQPGTAAAESKEDADDAACGSGRPVGEGASGEAAREDSSLASTSGSQPVPKKGCKVVYGGAPLPGALAGARFSFGGFNPHTERLYAERTGTPVPSAAAQEKEAVAAQDVRRGADVPAADMAHAFQRGGAADAQGALGPEKGGSSDRGGGQRHQSSGKKRKDRS